MSTWDEKTESYVQANLHDPPAGFDKEQVAALSLVVMHGARWQREALLSDESVERAARAISQQALGTTHAWEMYEKQARKALEAAIEGDES